MHEHKFSGIIEEQIKAVKCEDCEKTVFLKVVIITKDYYDQIDQSDKVLSALEAAGVDNWDGYEEAMEMLDDDS